LPTSYKEFPQDDGRGQDIGQVELMISEGRFGLVIARSWRHARAKLVFHDLVHLTGDGKVVGGAVAGDGTDQLVVGRSTDPGLGFPV
jgi:hypothetical protein